LFRPAGGDRVFDPVGQEVVLFSFPPLPEVVGDPGGDGVARNRLTALAGEQQEGEFGVLCPDSLEKLQSVVLGMS
jgi:hypothetical protein